MKLQISKAARQDLENIWLYTFAHWSLEQADRYHNLIMDEIAFLKKEPFSGKDYSTIREGYRRSRVKSHYIFYRVNREKKVVAVIRILHQSMDIKNRLNE